MDVADEIDVEYDRLTSGLDRQAVLAFAQHRSTLFGCNPVKLVHLNAVGELAFRYADVFFLDIDLREKKYFKQLCEAAGFLHEVMLQGCGFEDIIDLADEAVAKTVAQITPDMRCPGPKRNQLLSNQIGLASHAAQLVKLADLRHDCLVYSKLTETEPAKVRVWLNEATAVLGSFNKLRQTPLEKRLLGLKQDVAKLDNLTKAHRRRSH